MRKLKKVTFIHNNFAHIAKCACLHYMAIQLSPRQYFHNASTMEIMIQARTSGLSWLKLQKRWKNIMIEWTYIWGLSLRITIIFINLNLYKKCKNINFIYIIYEIFIFKKIYMTVHITVWISYVSYNSPKYFWPRLSRFVELYSFLCDLLIRDYELCVHNTRWYLI